MILKAQYFRWIAKPKRGHRYYTTNLRFADVNTAIVGLAALIDSGSDLNYARRRCQSASKTEKID